jgi:hypothetical protein
MLVFWRKHVAAMKKEEEEDKAEASKGTVPSVVIGGAASPKGKFTGTGNSSVATAQSPKGGDGGSDDDDEDDQEDEALSGLLSIGKGKKGNGKKSKNLQQDDLSNPLLGDVPIKVSESTSGSPLRSKGAGKKGGRGASNHSDDGGEEMKPMDGGKKGKAKGKSKGKDDEDDEELGLGRAGTKSKATDVTEKATAKKKKAK